jgi:hypothetical protein
MLARRAPSDAGALKLIQTDAAEVLPPLELMPPVTCSRSVVSNLSAPDVAVQRLRLLIPAPDAATIEPTLKELGAAFIHDLCDDDLGHTTCYFIKLLVSQFALARLCAFLPVLSVGLWRNAALLLLFLIAHDVAPLEA